MDLDVMSNSIERILKAKSNAEKATSDLKMSLLLSKLKMDREDQQLERKRQIDLQNKRAEKEMMTPGESLFMDEWKRTHPESSPTTSPAASNNGYGGDLGFDKVSMGATQPVEQPVPNPFNVTEDQLNPVILGPKGPERIRRSYKDVIYSNIMKIPEAQRTDKMKKYLESYLGGGEQQVIDPDTGEVLYVRPKGSVFKPTTGFGELDFSEKGLEKNQPQGQTTGQPTGRIRVKIKGGTQSGTIEAGEFDPNKYERI